ncbi:unnamed protein product, partial [marine sediment metagenome]
MTLGLVAFYVAVIFILAGCFPENLLEWSDDGSVGVIKVDKVLGLVDDKTGNFTQIPDINEQEDLFGNIAISSDGKLIAYSTAVKCSSLSDALKQLPQTQVKLIAHYANQMREQIIHQNGLVNEFPDIDEGPFKLDGYRSWVECYMCENADHELIDKLTPEILEQGKSKEIVLCQLFVATPNQVIKGEGELVTASVFAICWPKISPDNKFVAYLFHNEPYEDIALRFDLYLAALESDVKVLRLAEYVAPGYSWRGDSKA